MKVRLSHLRLFLSQDQNITRRNFKHTVRKGTGKKPDNFFLVSGRNKLAFLKAVSGKNSRALFLIKSIVESLGKSTDVLANRFSSHDYVGHYFGPESDEIKETTF